MEKIEVTASYSRKINHAMYGGNEYESSDAFCSMKEHIDPESDPKQAHQELAEMCRESVDNFLQQVIDSFGGIPQADFDAWKYNYVAGRPVDEETYHKMSKAQKDDIQLIKRAKATHKRDNSK